MTDSELAIGIEAERPDALEFLIENFHRPLLRYLWQAGGSREDAEDLSVQALLRVRADIGGFRGQGSLRSWIFRVAYRELLRHRRRQILARMLPPVLRESVQEFPEDFVVLAEALDRIPLDQRAAFLLTEVEGLSTEEASLALGVPIGTVKSRSHHARLRLRKLLGSTYGENHAKPAID